MRPKTSYEPASGVSPVLAKDDDHLDVGVVLEGTAGLHQQLVNVPELKIIFPVHNAKSPVEDKIAFGISWPKATYTCI